MKKRILSMLLVIVLVLSMVPASALAAEELKVTSTKSSKYVVIGVDEITLSATELDGTPIPTGNLTFEFDPADRITVVSSTDTSCKISGATQGEVTVKVTDASGRIGTKTLTVILPPENLQLVREGTTEAVSGNLKVGDTFTLGYTCSNSESIESAYITTSWKTQNVSPVGALTVSSTGVLNAVSEGTAQVRFAMNGKSVVQQFTISPADPPALEKLTIVADKTTMYPHRTLNLKAVDANGNEVAGVNWTSSDGTVADVASGVVTSYKTGDVVITAQKDGYEVATKTINVVANAYRITDAAGNAVQKVNVSETVQLQVRDAAGDVQTGFTWSTVGSGATVDPNTGVLSGEAKSTAPVVVKAVKNSLTVEQEISVVTKGLTVKNEKGEAVTDIVLYVGDTLKLNAFDSNGAPVTVKWNSFKPANVTVSADGLLTGVAATSGETPVTVKVYQDGYEDVFLNVKVRNKSTFLRLRLDNLERPQTLAVGETRTLMAFVDQSGVPVEGVTWSIPEDTACARLVGANKDQLKGLGAGTVEVTANKLGMEPETVTVTVAAVDLQSVDVNGVPNEMHAGESFNLKDLSIRYTPDYATDKTLVWRSGDPDVLDVDNARGVVTAKKAGQTKLYAKFADNTEVEIASVKVLTATAIVLDKTMPVSPAEVLAGEELVLKAALKDGATGDTIRTDVIWKLAKESDGDYCRIDNGNTLDTKSDLLGVRTVDLIATVNGKYDAADLHYQVKIIPRSSNVTLMIGTRKVNDKETVLNLNNDEECNAGITITAYVTPAEASQEVVWQVSDDLGIYTSYETEVSATAPHATINLKPTSYKRSGSITVKALAKDGTGECAVTTIYFEKLGSSNLQGAPTTLRGGASVDLRPYLVQDKNLDDKNVTWGVENNVLNGKKIASISKTGRLTTKAVSRPITITVTVKGSAGAPVPHDITLYPAVKTIKISSQDLGSSRVVELQRRGEVRLLQFDADITPDILEIDNGWTAEMPLVWSTTDKNIAEFLDPYSGELTVKRAGKVRIDCSATDGSKTKGSLLLDVVSPAGYVTITAASEEVVSGNSMNMKAVVYTAEGRKAAKQRVIWSVADEYGGATDAALISTTGRLTAKNVRMNTVVVVTATSAEDKEVFETVEVTIKPNTSKTLHALAFDGKLDDEGKLVDGGYTMNLNESCFIKGQWQMTSTGDVFEAEDCQFFSGNDMVASVDEEHGTLSAVGYGTATITLRCVDPDTKNVHTTTFTLKVTNKVSMVTVNAPTLRDIRSGQSVYLSATAWTDKVNNVKAENQSFNWEVYDVENDEAILDKASEAASISSNGVLYAKTVYSKHVVEVWAISKENNIIGKARFNIYPAASVALSFELDNEEYANILPLDIDDYVKDNTTLKTLNLKVMVHEAIADYQGNIKESPTAEANVIWSSDNKDVVEVKNNQLYVKAIGKAKLTAVYYRPQGGVYSANITVVVNQTVGSIVEIQTSNIDNILVAGKTAYLRAVFENANATNKNVLWSVDGPNADLVSLNVYTGRIKVKSNIGTEAIDIHVTAMPVDGSVGADEYITIHPRTTKVQILDEFDDVVTGKTIEAELSDGEVAFGTSVNPSDAYADHFKWTSSNTNVAEVDEEGTVTLKKVGAVTIKATALDGTGKYAKVKLRITNINP